MQTQIASLAPFIGGLNTEITQVTDAPLFTTDELNCTIISDGSRARRYGISVEDDAESYIGKNKNNKESLIKNSGEYYFKETTVLEKDTAGSYTFYVKKDGWYILTLVGAGAGGAFNSSSNRSSAASGGSGAACTIHVYLKGDESSEQGREYTIVVGDGGEAKGGKDANAYGGTGGNTYLSVGDIQLIVAFGGNGGHVWWPNSATEASETELPTVVEDNEYITFKEWTLREKGKKGNIFGNPSVGGESVLKGTKYGQGGRAWNAGGSSHADKGYVGYIKVVQREQITIEEEITNGFYWSNSDKKGRDIIVVRKKNMLYFYENKKPFVNNYITEWDISDYIADTENFYNNSVQFSSGDGILFIVSQFLRRGVYLTLDEDTITAKEIELKIRDLVGIEDNLAVDEQPTTLTKEHRYNLYNQAWPSDKIEDFKNNNSNKYPSNNLQWFIGKNATGTYSTAELLKIYFGTTPAPKGKYILDFFNKDRSAVSGIEDLPVEKIDEGISDVAFMSGRFFYLVRNNVLFSQTILEDTRNIEKCYQDADPTSEEISDIVDTDGGIINFQAIGKGLGLCVSPIGLVVLGKNSIYAINTTSNSFTATEYTTDLITDAGAYNRGSIVSADDTIFYWSPLGIYQITTDNITGTSLIANNISSTLIQSWYNNLPEYSKENAKGVYDYTNRRIIWYYPTNENKLLNLDAALVLDIKKGAFMPWKLANGGFVSSAFSLNRPFKVYPAINLWAGEDEVFASNDEVIAKEYNKDYDEYTSVSHIIYLAEYDAYCFGDYNSRDFLDWDKEEYDSYMLSFPLNAGSTYIKKYAPIIQSYFIRTEEGILRDGSYIAPSGCIIRARWNWSNSDISNRWDIEQQGYIPQQGFLNFKYVNGKARMRGRGESLQIYLGSDSNKDFRISGINLVMRS